MTNLDNLQPETHVLPVKRRHTDMISLHQYLLVCMSKIYHLCNYIARTENSPRNNRRTVRSPPIERVGIAEPPVNLYKSQYKQGAASIHLRCGNQSTKRINQTSSLVDNPYSVNDLERILLHKTISVLAQLCQGK